MALYKRLGMEDYYVKHNGWLEQDVADVLRDVESLRPSLVEAFRALGCACRLRELIETLLTTMLAEGLCRPERASSEFLPLLHRLIIGSKSLKDSLADRRWILRHIVVCTLCRHHALFESAGNADLLGEACSNFHRNMRVDADLLRLVDARIDAEEYAGFFGTATSLMCLTTTWLTWHHMGAAAALANSTTIGASLSMIGTTASVIASGRLGSMFGIRSACAAVDALLSPSESSRSEFADKDTCQQELQTLQSPSSLEQMGEGADQAVQEPSLNWYLWGRKPGLEDEFRRVLASDVRRRKRMSRCATT